MAIKKKSKKKTSKKDVRCPLTEPRTGDVVRSKKGRTRRVVYVNVLGRVVYDSVDYPSQPQKIIDLKTWIRWTKGGTIVENGDDIDHGYRDDSVSISYDAVGQITLIANRVMNEAERGTFTTTPSHLAIEALLELGIAVWLNGAYGIKKIVKERMIELSQQEPWYA